MKTKIFTLIVMLFSFALFSQSQIKQKNTIKSTQVSENIVYQLFPTQNFWTFIKLNTRNGKMWQVHFSTRENEGRGSVDLNSSPLVSLEKEINGRFTLYPSENTYNFILLDQIDGNVYQVQWSMDAKNRIVIPIE